MVNGVQHAGIFTAMGLLNDDFDDDTNLSYYSEISAESDYKLSDDQQSPEDNKISDSEEDTSHGKSSYLHYKMFVSGRCFTCSEDSNND